MSDSANLSMEAIFSLFDQMPPDILAQAAVELPRELERRKAIRKLDAYRPYSKQAEFHADFGASRLGLERRVDDRRVKFMPLGPDSCA